MNRRRFFLADLAKKAADAAAVAIIHDTAEKLRIVVVVTDEAGDFVGVGSTTARQDTLAMLKCALDRVDIREHKEQG